ncbi:hypothetical protein [Actinospongicola halichondriae]|uniref:hypothetical protein n=1 Tax=Actinospongicola halichondriae TaxID=3236844 RepID=UPI003D383BB9
MTNLLHLVVALVDDPRARNEFREDPEASVADVDDLTGEDVTAVADLARVQVDPAREAVLAAVLDLRAGNDESPRAVAVRGLLALCDAADALT